MHENVPLIELCDLSKSYHGIPAVKGVSLTFYKAEIHALLGENGAGKSTLTKTIAGVTLPTSGEILLDGKPLSCSTPAEALGHGIAMVFQETSLVPSMTVAQNLFLGKEKVMNRLRGVNIEAQQFLQALNFTVEPTALVSTLGAAQKQMVEIARSVMQKARLIIFDEPTATLTPAEKQHFFSLIHRLKRSGVAIVLITHALEEALSHADQISIMRDGELVVTGRAGEFDRRKVIAAMVGREISIELYSTRDPEKIRKAGDRIMTVRNLSMNNIVRKNSFSVFRGQITGIFGLVGSGRSETAKIIAGALSRDRKGGGEIEFQGRLVEYGTPREAIRDGIVYITEDRKTEGFFDSMSISENIYLASLSSGVDSSLLKNDRKRASLAEEWCRKLEVRAIARNASVLELSGGNQQKIVIAKSLVQEPKMVIFDEPTRGVDVGAVVEIHHLMSRLAENGHAVVMISSYLPEILNLSDRILVMRQGKVVEEFHPSDATQEQIMYAAVH